MTIPVRIVFSGIMLLALGVTSCRKDMNLVIAKVNNTPITLGMMYEAYEAAPLETRHRLYEGRHGPRNMLEGLIWQRVSLLAVLKAAGNPRDPISISLPEQKVMVDNYLRSQLWPRTPVSEAEIQRARKKLHGPTAPKTRQEIINYVRIQKNANWLPQQRAAAQVVVDQKALASVRF